MPKKYPTYIKEKAISMRIDRQMTVPAIADHLHIAKSTISLWVRDYPLQKRTNAQTIAQQRGTAAMQAKYAALREAAYEDGMASAPNLFTDPFFRDFVNMYLAEGYKKTQHTVEIGNSDVRVMQMAQHFIYQYANPENTIEYHIQLHADQDEAAIKQYWAKHMNVTPDMIRTKRKSNSGQLSGRQFRSPYGVLSIRVGDTYFRARLEAWMDYLRKLWLDKFSPE